MKNRALAGAVFGALLIAAHAQAKSPEKAGLQGEACAAQFARDNVVKPEAGPFRVRGHIQLIFPEHASSHELLTEVQPPQSVRLRGSVAGKPMDMVVLGPQQGWVKLEDGWHEAPQEELQGVLAAMLKTYVAAEGDVRCLPASRFQGRQVRSYRFHKVVDGEAFATVTVHFAASSGLPVAQFIEGVPAKRGAKQVSPQVRSEDRYEFDRSIRIDKPDGV